MNSDEKKPTPPDNYEVILHLNKEQLKADGSSIDIAIAKLKPKAFKTVGILEAHFGGKIAKKLLNIDQTKRLFGNRTYRTIISKILKLSLK